QREIESGVMRVRLNGEGVFVSDERLRQIARLDADDAKVVVGIEKSGIGLDGLPVILRCFGQPAGLLRLRALGESFLSGTAVSISRLLWRAIAITGVSGWRWLDWWLWSGCRRRGGWCRGGGWSRFSNDNWLICLWAAPEKICRIQIRKEAVLRRLG